MHYTRCFSIFILSVMLCVWPVSAQDQTTLLTLGVESGMQNIFTASLFADFETAHPGVQIMIVPVSLEERSLPVPRTADAVPGFVEKARGFAGRADVLFVDSSTLSAEFLRTGALLNLAPLLVADSNADEADFFPALLDSFRWDGAVWGLPVGASLGFLLYDQQAFDAAGLSYPNDRWTMDDFIHAGNTLSDAAQSGRIKSGTIWLDPSILLRSLSEQGITQTKPSPPLPLLDDPDLADQLEAWLPLYRAGQDARAAGVDFLTGPLLIGGSFLTNSPTGDHRLTATNLPGMSAAITDVQGFTVSAGTAYPELAYMLTQYLTQRPEVAYNIPSDTPGRLSLLSQFPLNPVPDTQAAIAIGLDHAFPASDMFFFAYINRALVKMAQDNLDAQTALQQVQQEVSGILTAISATAETSPVIVVAAPPPPLPVESNKIRLRFGLDGMEAPLPNQNLWDRAIAEFTAQDSQVGQVILDTSWLSLPDHAARHDCFYLNDNIVPDSDLSLLRDIEPLLAVDPTFSEADMVAGIMSQMRSQGGTWGLPITLHPLMLWYNPRVFRQAGVPEPVSDWDITAFADALRQIGVSAEGAPFRTETWGETYLLMLIAAYGGRLMDTTTEPTMFYLDDPANIAAAQQVLDLGRDGLIHYQALGTNYGGLFSISDSTPIYSAYLTTLSYRLRQRDDGDPYRAVTFPQGSHYTPLSYQPGVGYISADSPYPEACYRWLRYIAGQPALWDGMPASRSLLDDATFGFTAGDDLLALYQAFDAALQSPDALIFDALFHGSYTADSYANYPAKAISGMGRLWMLRAFDSYVLNAADLTGTMTAAQGYINDYALCISAIEPPAQPLVELDEASRSAYFDRFTNCAVTIDPSLESYFRQ